jgi:hypothetical protein
MRRQKQMGDEDGEYEEDEEPEFEEEEEEEGEEAAAPGNEPGSDEDAWLEALESDNLDERGDLKRKRPAFMTARQVPLEIHPQAQKKTWGHLSSFCPSFLFLFFFSFPLSAAGDVG